MSIIKRVCCSFKSVRSGVILDPTNLLCIEKNMLFKSKINAKIDVNIKMLSKY